MAAWPRGSYIRKVRSSSQFWMNHWRRSAMVAPGMTPTPPVTTRVGMPSVCDSTVWITRCERIRATPSSIALGQRGLGVVDDLLGDPESQRRARRPAWAAVAAGDVHGQLDRLHELGLGVPPQQRVQVAIDR